jgi:hypothetical protein
MTGNGSAMCSLSHLSCLTGTVSHRRSGCSCFSQSAERAPLSSLRLSLSSRLTLLSQTGCAVACQCAQLYSVARTRQMGLRLPPRPHRTAESNQTIGACAIPWSGPNLIALLRQGRLSLAAPANPSHRPNLSGPLAKARQPFRSGASGGAAGKPVTGPEAGVSV